jgi:hypothetical protein
MNDYDRARLVAQALLKGEQTPTRQIIQEKVKIAVDSTRTSEQGHTVEVDEEKLVRELESLFNIWMGLGTVLENKQGHIPWLADRNSEINWDFWNRYIRYLEEEKGWAPATTKGLDQLTDSILQRLENPLRSGTWDRRGMVVGQVQSGKTANYTGLICKAVDAGYKLIIVLAGIQNSLRSQTQIRLDEGFLGYDSQLHRASTQESSAIGVGLIPVGKRLIADSATNSANNGDFNKKVAGQFGVSAGGGNPLLFVVKKNTTVLKNLLQWALRHGDKDEKSGKRIVRGVPLLVIDDEADNASINTNPPLFDENGKVQEEYDVSAINGLIRKLLHSFERSAYVGYTATPFANIFIYPDPEQKNQEFGDDLFPRSFIINLPAPSNYIGPVEVFGLDTDPAIGLEASEALPIIRPVEDQKEWMPDKHKKDHVPGELPGSLKEAIRAFILCCAARIVRGQENEHNSMLVHVARFTAVQSEVAKQVKDELTSLQKRLRYGDSNAPGKLEEEFEQLWKDDFVPTTSSILSSIPDPQLKSVSWEEVKPLLHRAVSKIQVKKINGTAKDVLDYWEHKDKGLSVIAIGGDKLSRGLTLEGLSVSYYLRASKMYDTLMQMGRWFGYRPGYLDLCRLYTTNDLVEWYEHITVASEELRQEFDYMADAGATPDEFGLKVRTHPQGLIITGANKMKTGTVMQLSYTRSLSETTIFYKDENKNQQNLEVTEEMLKTLGEYSNKSNNYIWQDVPAKKITNFISGYQSHPKVKTANTTHLVDYIKAQLPQNELVLWTIVLISNSRGKKRFIAGHEVGTTLRKDASPESSQEYRLSKSRLLSPTDEWLDLPEATRQEILALTRIQREEAGKPVGAGNTPNGKILRSKRSPKNGLLLLYPLEPEVINSEIPVIGFVISFPDSKTAQMVEYKVNNVYWKEEFGQP